MLPEQEGVPVRRADPDCGADAAVAKPQHAGVPRPKHRRPPGRITHAEVVCNGVNGYNGVNFVFLDGSVRFLSNNTPDLMREAMTTIAEGDSFTLP